MEPQTKPPLGFVQRALPWLLAAGALLVYCLTLARWITIPGLGPLAQATGWDWHPVLHQPLHFLVTYPCRWLPPNLQIVGLNLLSAVCATLTLALLARSVALLPQDRTRDQRQAARGEESILKIPAAWLPPVLAVLVCGLQLTFWEHAVVWTGEAFDLLLFAYVIRCLLEFRIDPRDLWLLRMGVVYGLAMTDNFAMIAFLPALGIALVWLKGVTFFQWRFCLKMFFCLLAGWSAYLLLPLLYSSSYMLDQSFWDLLRVNLGFQKYSIVSFRRVIILMLSFTSLLPVLFIGIKWPATFGDISAAGNALTNLMMHVIHGVFLLACLYVVFDPAYSPRQLGTPYPFLTFYYLGALSIGYFSGYFLLVFGTAPAKGWQRTSPLRNGLNWGIVGLVWLALIAAPAGLIYQNLPRLEATLGPEFNDYARTAAKSLPAGEAVVLGDEPFVLYGVEAVLRQSGVNNKMIVESRSLPAAPYHLFLAKHYPRQWPQLQHPFANLSEPVDSSTVLQLLGKLGQSGGLYYLQPSFGYFFERFQLRPRNLIYELKPSPTNALENPTISAEESEQNIQFWQQMKNEQLKPLLAAVRPVKGKKPEGFRSMVAGYYSRAADYLGVELQKNGDLARASDCFGLAAALNAENASALINQEYNKRLQAGHPEVIKRPDDLEKKLSRYAGNWDLLLGWNGPIDEPGLRNDLAAMLSRGRNYRQAAQQLLRVCSLTPTNLDARIGLASTCQQAGFADLALNYISEVRGSVKKLHTADREMLLQTEAFAYASKDDLATAERVLREGQAQNPLDEAPYSTLAEIYLRLGRITNAMEVIQQQLKAQPENSVALNNFARLKIFNHEFEAAVKLLDHALSLDPKNMLIVMNRSISNLKNGQLDAAQRDYQLLEKSLPKVPYTVYFGLFDVAYKKKNPKAALKYGQLYLKGAPKGTSEFKDVLQRVKNVKSGSL